MANFDIKNLVGELKSSISNINKTDIQSQLTQASEGIKGLTKSDLLPTLKDSIGELKNNLGNLNNAEIRGQLDDLVKQMKSFGDLKSTVTPSASELQAALNQSIQQLDALTDVLNNNEDYKQKIDSLVSNINPNEIFSELKTAFNVKYPYNNSTLTESGHAFELDDTPGAERVALTHRTGTFFEVHPDGSKMEKIYNDNVQVVMRDNEIYIMGNESKTIQSNIKVYIKGNAKVQVDGEVEMEIIGNLTMKTNNAIAMANSFTFIGPINHVGDFKTTGNMLVQGNISSNKNIQSELDFIGHRNVIIDGYGDFEGDVTAGPISVKNHTHSDPQGGNTGPPQ